MGSAAFRMSDRGGEIWTPEPLWHGATVFLLGGGPSLRVFDMRRLRGHTVLAINSSCHSALAAGLQPALFFTDNHWFVEHRAVIEAWPGLVVTASHSAKAALPDKLRRIAMVQRPDFTKGEPILKFGRSSGHTAISLAIAMGAARVVLLGYDMRRVDGRSHHHDDYLETDDALYERDFLIYFRDWNQAAIAAGVEVLNATPGSALREFPMIDIDDLLRTDETSTKL